MPLPFIAEPIELLKARFPKCLARIWNPNEINAGGPRPGQFREYIFDFEEGLRLLISKTAFFPYDSSIHISASWEHDVPLNIETIVELTKQIEEKYHLLGGKGRLTFLGMSAHFVPHWLVIEDKVN